MGLFWVPMLIMAATQTNIFIAYGEIIRNEECHQGGARFDFVRKVFLLIKPLATNLNVTAEQCVRKCVRHPQCESIGYAKINSTCLLFDKGILDCENKTMKSQFWTHYQTDPTTLHVSLIIINNFQWGLNLPQNGEIKYCRTVLNRHVCAPN